VFFLVCCSFFTLRFYLWVNKDEYKGTRKVKVRTLDIAPFHHCMRTSPRSTEVWHALLRIWQFYLPAKYRQWRKSAGWRPPVRDLHLEPSLDQQRQSQLTTTAPLHDLHLHDSKVIQRRLHWTALAVEGSAGPPTSNNVPGASTVSTANWSLCSIQLFLHSTVDKIPKSLHSEHRIDPLTCFCTAQARHRQTDRRPRDT